MNTENLASELAKLSREELVSVFRKFSEKAKPYDSSEPFSDSKYFLGVATQSEDHWDVHAVAYPSGDDLGPDWGFCQESAPTELGLSLVSNMKDASCPITGKKIHLS
jgi:hypothetical protein